MTAKLIDREPTLIERAENVYNTCQTDDPHFMRDLKLALRAVPAAPAREWSDAEVDVIVHPIITCVNDPARDMARKLVRAGLAAAAPRAER